MLYEVITDPAVVHTGAHVKHRRNAHGFTHFSQTRSAIDMRGSRGQQAFHGTGDPVAAGGQNDHVIFDQLFNQGQMRFVVPGSGVVAAHHTGYAPDTAIDNVVIEGVIGPAESSTQMIFNRLNASYNFV